ncbi:MAG: hypothetical protein KC910_27025 [Candidatus Eremiobacteraeota bacterium]|nr:hypothetical protein [Candidatus Eremiobacteraeota bacterium]
MAVSNDFLIAVRRILNETRQDRHCRPMLEKRDTDVLVPFLGCSTPTYLFLGACPVGYDLEGVPRKADEYIDFATSYFGRDDTDKAPFVQCLPFTANHHEDYTTFGQVAMVANIVPVPAERSSEVTVPLLEACWPRLANLILAVKPKLLLCHGSAAWKFLAGLEEGHEAVFTDLPESHRLALKDVYQKVPGNQLPFKTGLRELEGAPTWILPLPNLGKSAPARADREKGEQGLAQARRLLYDQPSRSRIRVRRPG